MPVAPVHPGQIVWRLIGLRLRHVMLRVTDKPFDVEYLYGRIPIVGSDGALSMSGKSPKYVLISENTTLPNAPSRTVVPQGGYWIYDVPLICRHLGVSVWTNVSASVALNVGRQLRGRAGCGKVADVSSATFMGASCTLHLRSGGQVCFGPAQVAQAERQAPFPVIRPGAAVQSVIRLPLAQVSVISEQGGRVVQIAYIYGHLRSPADLLALPGPGAQRYVLVQKITGAVVSPHPWIGRASLSTPWRYTAVIHQRHLSLIVTSNLSRADVQAIGSRLRIPGGKS